VFSAWWPSHPSGAPASAPLRALLPSGSMCCVRDLEVRCRTAAWQLRRLPFPASETVEPPPCYSVRVCSRRLSNKSASPRSMRKRAAIQILLRQSELGLRPSAPGANRPPLRHISKPPWQSELVWYVVNLDPCPVKMVGQTASLETAPSLLSAR